MPSVPRSLISPRRPPVATDEILEVATLIACTGARADPLARLDRGGCTSRTSAGARRAPTRAHPRDQAPLPRDHGNEAARGHPRDDGLADVAFAPEASGPQLRIGVRGR